jgi:hypothetical protein
MSVSKMVVILKAGRNDTPLDSVCCNEPTSLTECGHWCRPSLVGPSCGWVCWLFRKVVRLLLFLSDFLAYFFSLSQVKTRQLSSCYTANMPGIYTGRVTSCGHLSSREHHFGHVNAKVNSIKIWRSLLGRVHTETIRVYNIRCGCI